jgi:hypothetical protein
VLDQRAHLHERVGRLGTFRKRKQAKQDYSDGFEGCHSCNIAFALPPARQPVLDLEPGDTEGVNREMTDSTLDRLEDQISWYDRKSNRSQSWYKGLKLLEIGSAALIPFLAGVGAPSWLTGGFGVLIVVLEGIQHLNQYQHNWITYRSTCEFLKHEKYLYLAKAGPYSTPENSTELLAERIESLISQEHARWVSGREQREKRT